MNIRNILLVGRTGSGKSTLANVLINEFKENELFREVFKESSGSVSETKNIQHQEFIVDISANEKIRYLVIDTAGFGDTQLTTKEILQLLEGLVNIVGNEGLNQIFFVNDGRFTQAEIETYRLLESVLFDQDVAKYTTIVRTKFEDFENTEICDQDRKKLREENQELLGVLKNSKIVYVDNPKTKGRYADMAKDTRAESRKRLITYLGTCQETYKPANLDTLKLRISDYKTKTEQLENEITAKKQAIKDEEAKLQRDIQAAKTQQQSELEASRRDFDQQIQNSRYSYDQQLQNARNQLQVNYQRQINESQSRFFREQSEAEMRRQLEINNIRSGYETVQIGEYFCSQGHSSSLEYYDKYGTRFYGGDPYFTSYIRCPICGFVNDYNYTVRNVTTYSFADWCRMRNQDYAQKINQMNQQIQEKDRQNQQIIFRIQQERNSRDAAFQQELDQQTQHQIQSINQQRTNNESSLNQQRSARESQINDNASSRENDLRNQSNQQIQGWQAQIQQAEQGRNANQNNFDQYIEQLVKPFGSLWKK